jgi:hypothetical protein
MAPGDARDRSGQCLRDGLARPSGEGRRPGMTTAAARRKRRPAARLRARGRPELRGGGRRRHHPGEWVASAIDAHIKLGFAMTVPWRAASTWRTKAAIFMRSPSPRASILRSVEEWGEGDVGATTRRAVSECCGAWPARAAIRLHRRRRGREVGSQPARRRGDAASRVAASRPHVPCRGMRWRRAASHPRRACCPRRRARRRLNKRLLRT